VRGEAHAFPAAERFAAQNEQRRARAELETLLEQRIQHVDLRLAALNRLNGRLQSHRAGDCRRSRGRRGSIGFDSFLEVGDRLADLWQEGDGVDVRLNALKGGFELLVDQHAHVLDGRADLGHHLLDRIAHVRVDRARDFLAPHSHKSSGC
jgi:hypothetical protein